jgi:plasmid replication initiation protein
MPKESDSKGTAFRIRPQTPKLNLLNYDKQNMLKTKKRPHHLEALPSIPKPRNFHDELTFIPIEPQ